MPRARAPDHVPVLLAEVVDALAPRAGGRYVDCTFGRGGHARALLERIGGDGRLLVIDRDPLAVAAAAAMAAGDARLTVVHENFARLGEVAARAGLMGKVDGIVLDLGLSSPQLDDAGRGFSFRHDAVLDMRMDPGTGESAAAWLERATEAEIADVIHRYGEERHARRIARAIVASRARAPIRTTRELADLVVRALPRGRARDKHPATRTFQAIRMHVNGELDALASALAATPAVLAPGGRLAVVSFHSLEDRMVKRFIRDSFRPRTLPRGLPVTGDPPGGVLRPIGRARRPHEREIAANPRARSAVLRVAERLP